MRLSHRLRCRAFTLVELLVVIAIIGILVALLLPAVQAAREAARRTQCTNQLKQFALGCVNHESVTRHFPTGGWGWNWVGDADRGFGQDQPGGWIYNILPFMEETARHDMPKDGKPKEHTDPQLQGATELLVDPLPILYCPSRRSGRMKNIEKIAKLATNAALNASGSGREVGRSDYAANAGDISIGGGTNGPSGLAVVEMGLYADKWLTKSKTGLLREPVGNTTLKLTGISFQRSEVAIRHVADGTSKTYLVGEKYLDSASYDNGKDTGDNETWCTGHNNDNFRVTADVPRKDTFNYEHGGLFGSNHDSVWNVAYCDGHVEAMSFDIDPLVHRYNGNREDGTVVSE